MSAPAKRIEHPSVELLSPPRPDIRLVHSVSEAELRALKRPTEHPGVCFRRDSGRSRRGSSGRRRGANELAALFAQVKSIFGVTADIGGVTQRPFIFDADYYAVDGVSGKVASLIDHLDPTHAAAQGTSALQVAVPTADSALNNAPSYVFTGSQYYVSNRASNSFRWLHGDSNTPCTTLAVFVCASSAVRINTLWTTYRRQEGSTNRGGLVWFDGGSPSLAFRVVDSGNVLTPSAAVPFADGSAYSVWAEYAEGVSPAEIIARVNGDETLTGDSLKGPGTGDPQSTLVIGANAVSYDSGAAMRLAALFGVPKQLSTDEADIVSAYTTLKYGVAA